MRNEITFQLRLNNTNIMNQNRWIAQTWDLTSQPFSSTSRASSRSDSSLKSSSRARALAFKLEHYQAFVLFTLSLKLGSSFCRALHFYIVNFDFEREKSSIELLKIRLDRALSLFTSSLKKSSSLILGSKYTSQKLEYTRAFLPMLGSGSMILGSTHL